MGASCSSVGAVPSDEFRGVPLSLPVEKAKKERAMFESTTAYSGFAAPDLDRAQEFYGETLGLKTTRMGDDLLTLHLANGRDTLVYLKPDHTPATYTILNFVVEDSAKAVDALAERGIGVERYEGMNQDEKGIDRDGPNIAWFKDPAGNILSVHEDV
jgi:catechol 2,3-dioxygenase-like lactoylglutathione lyase family enzyme